MSTITPKLQLCSNAYNIKDCSYILLVVQLLLEPEFRLSQITIS